MASKLVAVTGITGFIGSNTVVYLCQRGWKTRASVRREEQVEEMRGNLMIGPYVRSGQCELVVVPDFRDEAVKDLVRGVDAVIHIATSMGSFVCSTWEEAREDAIGTTTYFMECCAEAPSIKAVSLMSSFAAIAGPFIPKEGKTWSEDDWAMMTDDDCAKPDPKAVTTRGLWYGLSKKIVEEVGSRVHKSTGASFALSTMCPTVTLGPPIQINDPRILRDRLGISISSLELSALLLGKDKPLPANRSFYWVHVGDQAKAFEAVIERNLSGRYLIGAGTYSYQLLADTLRELRPDLDEYIPLGTPGGSLPPPSEIDNSKSETELGLKYQTKEAMLMDGMACFEAIGLIPQKKT